MNIPKMSNVNRIAPLYRVLLLMSGSGGLLCDAFDQLGL